MFVKLWEEVVHGDYLLTKLVMFWSTSIHAANDKCEQSKRGVSGVTVVSGDQTSLPSTPLGKGCNFICVWLYTFEIDYSQIKNIIILF